MDGWMDGWMEKRPVGSSATDPDSIYWAVSHQEFFVIVINQEQHKKEGN